MKIKKLLVHKAMLAAVCLACALSMSACGKKDKTNENKDPLTGEDMSQTDESSETDSSNTEAENGYSGFDAMINDENTNPNDIIGYINTNIVSAGVNDIERFFTGLLSFGSDIRDINFEALNDSRQYMPEDMIAFMDLMSLESEKPSMVMSDSENRRVINMTLSEMLERAVLFEHHLEKYPNGVTADAASRLYEEIATNAISGGYDKTAGISHYYKGDSDDTVAQESLQYYQQFADANKDSNLGRIVEDYINVLQTSQFKIDDNLENFYMGLHERLGVSNLINTTDDETDGAGTNETTGTNQNSTNGNDTNENSTTNNSGSNGSTADTVIEGTVLR